MKTSRKIISAFMMVLVITGAFFAGGYYNQNTELDTESEDFQNQISHIQKEVAQLKESTDSSNEDTVKSSSSLAPTENIDSIADSKGNQAVAINNSSSVTTEVKSNNEAYEETPIPNEKAVEPAPLAIHEDVSSVAVAEPLPQTNNSDSPFGNYEVTVYDSTKPAVRSTGYGWPMTTYSFIAADGTDVGSITAEAYDELMNQNKVIYPSSGGWYAPNENGDWETWFAEIFNNYRGVSFDITADNAVDTDAYAMEVIALVNKKREELGLNILEIDDNLMEHSAIRAEELAIQFSHERPNGTVEKSECAGQGSKTPAKVFQAWMDSDPHRNAILNESGRFLYNEIGSGCYQDEGGKFYWIITFGT